MKKLSKNDLLRIKFIDFFLLFNTYQDNIYDARLTSVKSFLFHETCYPNSLHLNKNTN